MTNDKYKKIFDDIKIFSSGIKTSACANDNKKEAVASKCPAFPVLKLVTGGVSSSFFGVIKLPHSSDKHKNSFL